MTILWIEVLALLRTVVAAVRAMPELGHSDPALWFRTFPVHLRVERGRLGRGRWAKHYGPKRWGKP